MQSLSSSLKQLTSSYQKSAAAVSGGCAKNWLCPFRQSQPQGPAACPSRWLLPSEGKKSISAKRAAYPQSPAAKIPSAKRAAPAFNPKKTTPNRHQPQTKAPAYQKKTPQKTPKAINHNQISQISQTKKTTAKSKKAFTKINQPAIIGEHKDN